MLCTCSVTSAWPAVIESEVCSFKLFLLIYQYLPNWLLLSLHSLAWVVVPLTFNRWVNSALIVVAIILRVTDGPFQTNVLSIIVILAWMWMLIFGRGYRLMGPYLIMIRHVSSARLCFAVACTLHTPPPQHPWMWYSFTLCWCGICRALKGVVWTISRWPGGFPPSIGLLPCS